MRNTTPDFVSQALFFRRLSQEKIQSLGIRKVIRGLVMGRGLRQILRRF